MSAEPRAGHVRRGAVALAIAGAALLALAGFEISRSATRTTVPRTLATKTQQPIAEDRWPRRTRVYPASFPAGAGEQIAERSCALCHSAMLTTQQHKDSTAWEKTLTTMLGWGAPVDSSDRGALRGYLVKYFGPRAP